MAKIQNGRSAISPLNMHRSMYMENETCKSREKVETNSTCATIMYGMNEMKTESGQSLNLKIS